LDLMWLRQLAAPGVGGILELFADDVVAQLDALVADEDRRPRDQLADFVLALAAKRTIEELAVLVLAAGIIAHCGVASVSRKCRQARSLYNTRPMAGAKQRPAIFPV